MSNNPIRIQGGIYLWVCALIFAVLSLHSLLTSYKGILIAFFLVVMSSLVGLAVYKAWERSIKRNFGSVDGERGPLLALSIASAGFFVHYMYMSTAFSFYNRIFVACGLILMISPVAVAMARGLNSYDFKISRQFLVRRYNELGSGAQYMCILLGSLIFLSLVFAFAALLVNALDIGVVMAIANLIITTVLHIVCLAKTRVIIMRIIGNRYFALESVKRFVSLFPFTIYEYIASLAAAGLVTIFLLVSMWKSHNIVGMSLGLVLAYVFETVFIWLDRVNVQNRLRHIWRDSAVRAILDGQEIYFSRKLKKISEIVLESSDFGCFDVDSHSNVDMRCAESLRHAMNYYFCENGKMKYISKCERVLKSEILKRRARELMSSIICYSKYNEASLACLSDADIAKQSYLITNDKEKLSWSDEYLSHIRKILIYKLEKIKLPAVSRLLAAFKCSGRFFEVAIDVSDNGDVRIYDGDKEISSSSKEVIVHIESLILN